MAKVAQIVEKVPHFGKMPKKKKMHCLEEASFLFFLPHHGYEKIVGVEKVEAVERELRMNRPSFSFWKVC